jgi:tRNA threonylcarbamoyl adenosine modification protein (Sua5/YciO/YrdC/YwlC family)
MGHPRTVQIRPGSEAEAVRLAAEALAKGALVIVPTDTVYGIAADPRLPEAEALLCRAKGRDRRKPIPLLAAQKSDLTRYGAVLGKIEHELADRFWPGPLTLVVRVRGRASARHEGFRIPDCDVTRALIRQTGGVLRVTSANVSGETPALTVGEAIRSLGPFVEIALDAGTAPGGTPSTVAQIESDRLKVIREGAIAREQLEAAF